MFKSRMHKYLAVILVIALCICNLGEAFATQTVSDTVDTVVSDNTVSSPSISPIQEKNRFNHKFYVMADS